MQITDQIDFDVQSLRTYFEQLFLMEEQTSKMTRPPIVLGKLADQFIAENVAAFIRPDMTNNVYSLVDFWLTKLCLNHQSRKNLALSHKDIRGKNDLDAFHKYLTKVMGLDLNGVSLSLEALHDLRKVRNCYVHGGGHINEERQKEVGKVDGVQVAGSLVLVSNDFIWKTLEHANKYLRSAARA
jgi:hypothetical protein